MELQDKPDFRTIASQLRLPEGAIGKEVGATMNKGNRLMNLEAIKHLGISDNDNILEIGMGNGFFVKDILSAANDVNYYGCDFSGTMVEEAILLNKSYEKNAHFLLAQAASLPFEDGFFIKVLTVNTIYFWENPSQTLAEIRRVLKPNGSLIISLRPKSLMDKLPFTEFGFTTYTKDNAVNLLGTNHFEIISAIEYDDDDLKFAGEIYKNSFLIIKVSKI